MLYAQKYTGVLVDTNLLILILVGKFNRQLITKFKRTSIFSVDDYEKIISIIVNNNNKIFTTPNILTEVTNLTDNDILNKGKNFFKFLAAFINDAVEKELIEIVYSSQKIIENNHSAFVMLGLTDASIMNVASNNILTITTDVGLFNALLAHSKPAINYNELLNSLQL